MVNQQIDNKNKALAANKYNIEYDEAWLLLIIENNVGSEFELPKQIKSHLIHNFKKVYIFESLYHGLVLVDFTNKKVTSLL